ncbi:hypothetical protein Lser_V15G21835 [Lactuca serriola]
MSSRLQNPFVGAAFQSSLKPRNVNCLGYLGNKFPRKPRYDIIPRAKKNNWISHGIRFSQSSGENVEILWKNMGLRSGFVVKSVKEPFTRSKAIVRSLSTVWEEALTDGLSKTVQKEDKNYAKLTYDPAILLNSANVLDQWINSATQSLVHFVRQEMDAYRLYTVVPYLLKFIDNLTNIYIRFNRKRLKGRTGEDDCRTALSALYHVLLTCCKEMAPFTPFFTEILYRNLRKVSNGSEESIHFCSFPQVEGKHIHHNEVILTLGSSRTVIEFLCAAKEKKRSFRVFVAEGAPRVFEIDNMKAWKSVLIFATSYALGLFMIAKSPWYFLPLAWAWTETAVTGV